MSRCQAGMFEYQEPKIAIEAREYHALHTLDLHFPSYAFPSAVK